MSKRHWLTIAEYLLIASSLGGVVVTAITKQILFSVSPLTLALFLNVVNRQRQFKQLDKLPENVKLISFYNDFVSITNDYRAYKLLIQESMSYTVQKEEIIQIIQQRLSELENSLHHLSHLAGNIQGMQQSLGELLKDKNVKEQRLSELETSLHHLSHLAGNIQDMQQSLGELLKDKNVKEQRLSEVETSLDHLSHLIENIQGIQKSLGELLNFVESLNQPSFNSKTYKKTVNSSSPELQNLLNYLQSLFNITIDSDYSQLIILLASHQWEKADQETAKKMIEIMERQDKDDLRTRDIKRFSVNQLQIIDQLWIYFSQGKFGFSVQKDIWTELGGETGKFRNSIYDNWAKKVGWRVNDSWKKYDELDFSLNAPTGHLPAVTLAWSSWGAAWCGDETVKLFSKLNYNSSTKTNEYKNSENPIKQMEQDIITLGENLESLFKKN
ncbi:GUN4 domain protein [Gloeothece citriformis PCC 7424]|uniref:GUN4 domain protein n=1 Tax=Gloeothece citriformis (strain PCC 7424) TaxID=65393 RepID=B7KGX3_GLOC7|nr:GUN4 domain-containing protein [Gloeothece citriformis]ACK73460.1 GUN4 domain protein [Gloeothece citriformis PCC 7424]